MFTSAIGKKVVNRKTGHRDLKGQMAAPTKFDANKDSDTKWLLSPSESLSEKTVKLPNSPMLPDSWQPGDDKLKQLSMLPQPGAVAAGQQTQMANKQPPIRVLSKPAAQVPSNGEQLQDFSIPRKPIADRLDVAGIKPSYAQAVDGSAEQAQDPRTQANTNVHKPEQRSNQQNAASKKIETSQPMNDYRWPPFPEWSVQNGEKAPLLPPPGEEPPKPKLGFLRRARSRPVEVMPQLPFAEIPSGNRVNRLEELIKANATPDGVLSVPRAVKNDRIQRWLDGIPEEVDLQVNKELKGEFPRGWNIRNGGDNDKA